jgi:uncharacterized protein (TIGR03546 family)
MNVRRWFQEHSLKLLAIRDTPQAIAGGVAIGIFFGFVPVFGLKTLSAIFVAWLTRSNIIAAVLAGTLHDVILPFMPVLYAYEYKVGFWLLSHPHHWPAAFHKMNWDPHVWLSWTTFLTVGKPMLVGSIVCAAPVALVSFAITRGIVERHQRKKAAELQLAEKLDFDHRPIKHE